MSTTSPPNNSKSSGVTLVIMDYDKINKQDILCGKEKKCVSHPGSINFRQVIDDFAPKYAIAVTKQEKMNVTKEIYDMLGSQNARFLKYSSKSKGWEELSSLLARDKISHALRFANREKKASSNSSSVRSPISNKKGHRRTGSEESNSTVTTVATELSLEEFENLMMDDEPLDWQSDHQNSSETRNSEAEFRAYEDSYERATHTPYPTHNYYDAPSYQHYYYPPHPYAGYHYGPPPPPASRPFGSQERSLGQAPVGREVSVIAEFPEKPLPAPPVRNSSMDVDLEFLVSEPLMEWDMESEEVFVVS